MHNSVKITIFLPTPFLQGGVILIFPCSLYSTTYLVEHPGCLSSHCGLLGILRSNFAIFWSKQRSPTREQRGAITALYLVIIYIEVLGVVYKFIYLLLFYKPIQGSSKFMRPCMYLSTVDVSLVRSEYFFLCLSARPFLGLFGKVDAPPVFFLPRLAWSASTHYCFVLQGVYQHLGYLLALAFQPCPIWTIAWGVRSILEVLFLFRCIRRFWRGFRSGQGIFPITPTRTGLSIPTDLFGYIYSCLWFFECLTARLTALLSGVSCLSLSFPMMKGDPKFLEGLLCSVSWNLLPALFVSWWRRSRQADFYSPKVPNFLGGYPNLLEVIFCDWERCPRKSANFPLFSSYHDGEGLDCLFPFSLTVFQV